MANLRPPISNLPLILASRSPQRIRLLKSIGLKFKIYPSRISENSSEKNPLKLVRALAFKKALAVAKKFPNQWVLAADTIVYCQNQIIIKPSGIKDAQRLLKLLSGRWHKVYTGVALLHRAKNISRLDHCISRVKARKVGPDFIKRFSRKHQDKSGGYGVQDREDPFIEKIQGALDNVLGLPCKTVQKLLRQAISRKVAATFLAER